MIDIDATLADSHCGNQDGAGTCKRGFGLGPLMAPPQTASRSSTTPWLQLSMAAHGLLAWTELLAVDGAVAEAEPERLRRCLLRAAARLAHTGRRRVA